MIYFIPAWYAQNNWRENEEVWYRRKDRSEFDETIKQIQLLHRSMRVPYEILLLSYAPNFRHFLHRQGIFRAGYWSVFDAICQIKRGKISVTSFYDLKWPEGVEFAYSPFAVLAYLKGQKYAQVEFGENGNFFCVIMYENDVICRRNEYDDRGFLSSTTVYKDGQPEHRDYLMEDGTWKMREYLTEGRVEINPKCPCFDVKGEPCDFKNKEYKSMEAVIKEVLYANAADYKKEDIFVLAAHSLHMDLLYDLLRKNPVVITFFENRFNSEDIDTYWDFLCQASYLITDSADRASKLEEKLDFVRGKIFDISPYDTRVDFGISSRLKVQKILIPIDGLEEKKFEELTLHVADYLTKNDRARVHFFTRNPDADYEKKTMAKVETLLDGAGYSRGWITDDPVQPVGENEIDDLPSDVPKVEEKRFFWEQHIDERSISKCLNEQRVILDIRGVDDVFLFINAISKGVPRITTSLDAYVSHKHNGFLIAGIAETEMALSYYLDSMENWNSALVGCYEMGQKYTTAVLMDKWNGVINSFG